MDLPETYEDFADYLKPGLEPWIERGLVKNAPQKAIDAYEEFKKIEAENEQNEE
jgi:hypothetical protein